VVCGAGCKWGLRKWAWREEASGVGTVDPRGGDCRPQVKLLKRSQWLCFFGASGVGTPDPTLLVFIV